MKRKLFAVPAVMLATMLFLSCQSDAGVITTTFANNNAHDGNMFDLNTFGNGLTVTGLTINKNTGTLDLEVWIRNGSYVGNETSPAGWNLVSSTNGIVGPAGATFADVTDFSLAANSNYGVYVTGTGPSGLRYTDGSATFSNADLQLTLGIGKAYPWASTFNPRTWNGSIHYDLNSQTVPEPTSAMIYVGIACSVLVRRRYKRA